MIGHDAEVPALDIEEHHDIGKNSQKGPIVTIVQEDPHSSISTRHDVANQVGFQIALVTGHAQADTFFLPSRMLGISGQGPKQHAEVLETCDDESTVARLKVRGPSTPASPGAARRM
jgi:hypothetical protein